VLANEQVIDGCCWRCDTKVERKEIAQWFLRITEYAQELLDSLDTLDGWPEQVKTMQANWIGRSEGVEIDFQIPEYESCIRIYTTRPDTLMGVTYLAIAAEHPLAIKASQTNAGLRQFIDACKAIETSEAAIETIEKLGIYSGITAVHPVSGESIPVWIANFVLMNYGTGAVMSVPAHDQRDFEFAHKYHIPIKQVIFSEHGDDDNCDKQAYTSKGILKNSGQFNDLLSYDANHKIIEYLEKNGKGQKKVNFRLRDWGVSRQRYWGAPIPVIYCDHCGTVPVPDKDLPVMLPKDITLDGSQSPLVTHPSFSSVNCPTCGASAKRETDTFDTFMESSWYFARFASQPPHAMLDSSVNDWLPVDHYIGGIEHAILHLLYARFYTKLLRDLGLVKCSEPFKKLLTQGMVLLNGSKMSKSKGNTIDPQALIDKYGADTVRLFIMFAAPPEQSLEWSADGVEGASRFLKRLWRQVHLHTSQHQGDSFQIDFNALTEEQLFIRRHLHQSIQKVTHDMSVRMIFNTAIAANMELINSVSKFTDESANGNAIRHEILSSIVLMLSPIVPHICDELWLMLGYNDSVMTQNWPQYDEKALIQSSIELMIQINGKLRAKISVPASASNKEIEEIVLSDKIIIKFINELTIKKFIIVPQKLVNIVV
jgi:leucyl-tRNA synthetase